MSEEKIRYIQLMVGDSFKGHFERQMSDADLSLSPEAIAPERAGGFCDEIKMVFGIEVSVQQSLQETVQVAYESSKDDMLTADEFVNDLDD